MLFPDFSIRSPALNLSSKICMQSNWDFLVECLIRCRYSEDMSWLGKSKRGLRNQIGAKVGGGVNRLIDDFLRQTKYFARPVASKC